MNGFFCALRIDGGRISKRELVAYLARMQRRHDWDSCCQGAFTAVVATREHSLRPLLAQHQAVMGAGDVRLDNRREIAALSGIGPDASDLEVVLAALDKLGPALVPRLLGDFAFVACDARAQRIVAARDAFGVKPLYYRRTREHLLLASRLDPLSGDERLDADYVADFLIGLPGPSPRTIWQGALQLEPGAVLLQRGSVTAQNRYWDPHKFEPAAAVDEHAAVEHFRELFADAVRNRVAAEETWSQLSGGLDSSAVTSTAQWLHQSGGSGGLRGTVTIVDSLGNGDERRYSDLVLARYRLPNEAIADYWPWRSDDGGAPAATDEPSPLFPFFARDNRMADIVTHGGGKVLLSGLGSDHYMFGTLAYMADLLAKGSLRAGAREVLGWALQSRRSFWHTARVSVVHPLFFNFSRRSGVALPRWLNRDFARRTNVIDRLADVRSPQARLGRMFITHSAVELKRVSNWIHRGAFQERMEVRYPFLCRKLVEFTLQLPVDLKLRPQGRKWVLREAMRGILPEEIRRRSGKGGMDARVLWTLQHERTLIEALLADSHLADLGFINTHALKATIESARHGVPRNTVHVLSVLALESWLRARSGSWPSTISRRSHV